MKKFLQALLILSGVCSVHLSAEDGILDGTFGAGDGKVTTGVGTSLDQFFAVAVQPDGKIVAAGVTLSSVTYDFVVVRYNANGSLDNTFGSGGKVVTDLADNDDWAYAIALQPDGKIVVGGYTTDTALDSFAVVRYNSDGSLDNTFGSGGKVVTEIGSTNDKAQSMAIQTDGKIVMAGYSNNGSNNDFAVVRYNSDGTLDNTFDGDGKVTTPIGSSDDQANSVALQPNGKIVVAGYAYNGTSNDFAVVRYNSDGSLDNTFDTDGKAILSISGTSVKGKSVAIQSDGKIVVEGFSSSGIIVARFKSDGIPDSTFDSDGITATAFSGVDQNNSIVVQQDGKIIVTVNLNDFSAVRYNSNGTLDNTFDSDGIVNTPIGTGLDRSTSATLQLDGKIVVAGYSSNGSNYDGAVVRYNTDGSLDSLFDNGRVITAIGASIDEGYSTVLQPDGKIIATGTLNDFAVVRYNSNGSLDNTFNDSGFVSTPIGAGLDRSTSVALQSDGKIVVAGYSINDGAVVRYNTDGSLDNTFDSEGKVTTPIGSSLDRFYAVAVQPDGKIVSAGVTLSSASYDFAVVRYNSDGSLDNTFGSGGKVVTDVGTPDDYAYTIALQSDGKIVVGGYVTDTAIDSFAIVRYNSDGSLDNTFGSGGKVTTSIGSTDDVIRSIVVQSDGKIVAAGYSYNGSNYDFAVTRYNSNGTLDNTFDSDGKLTIAIGTLDDQANSVALQPDGKIVVAGYSNDGTNNTFAVVRYNSNGTLDNTFDTDGKATLSLAGTDIKGKSVAIQSDGNIVVAGLIGSGIIVARFTGSSSAPLPVELVSFTASLRNNGVELQWNTATEVNNYGFEIQRAEVKGQKSEVGWTKIGFVEGSGTTNTAKAYSFTDAAVRGKVAYRLKQIDNDGKFNYSSEVEVLLEQMPKAFWLEQNYPNPFNPSTTISFSIPNVGTSEKTSLRVYDALGREVATLVNEVKEAGSYSVTFNASNLASGIYFARLQSNGKQLMKKMLLMK